MISERTRISRSKIGKVYKYGCTHFVADVVGVPQKNSSLWTRGAAVSKADLSGGDVIGWDENGSKGHVLIYDGEKYLNCRG